MRYRRKNKKWARLIRIRYAKTLLDILSSINHITSFHFLFHIVVGITLNCWFFPEVCYTLLIVHILPSLDEDASYSRMLMVYPSSCIARMYSRVSLESYHPYKSSQIAILQRDASSQTSLHLSKMLWHFCLVRPHGKGKWGSGVFM